MPRKTRLIAALTPGVQLPWRNPEDAQDHLPWVASTIFAALLDATHDDVIVEAIDQLGYKNAESYRRNIQYLREEARKRHNLRAAKASPR
jgi:hypothetical protein